jgi:hypothetical protein
MNLVKGIIVIYIIVTTIGCETDYEKETIVVDVKYCISECMSFEFERFHNKGSSWGTGSSSMGGLSQGSIYDRVKVECVEFYKNEKCCKREPRDYTRKNVSRYHGYEYGECLNRIKERGE